MNKSLRILLGLVIAFVCMWLSFRNFSWHEIRATLLTASYQWFIPAFFLIVFNFFLRALRWQLILSPLKKVKSGTLFMLLTFGFFMNNVLPARAGEVVRAVAANRLTTLPTSTCLGSIALERLTDIFGLIIIIIIAIGVLPAGTIPIGRLVMLMLAGTFLAITFIVFFQKNKHTTSKYKYIEKGLVFIRHLSNGFLVFKSPIKIGGLVLFSASIWIIDALSLLITAQAFSLFLSFRQAAAVLVGIAVGVMIPGAPGYVGTFEFFGKESLVFLGFPAATSLSFILTLHVFQVLVLALLGTPGLIRIGLGTEKKIA